LKNEQIKHLRFSPWQRNYNERIIRNENSFQIISEYIINNPAKWENDMFNPVNIDNIQKNKTIQI